MSEVLTSGMVGIPLDGPVPRPPLYGLPSVALEIPWVDRGGWVITPYPDGMIGDPADGGTGPVSSHDPCSDGSARIKDMPNALTIPAGFPSWTAYLGEVCTAYNIGDWNEWKARANLALAAREAWALERQLADHSFAQAPSLTDATDLINSGTAVTAAVAVAALDEVLSLSGIAGVIHLTPGVTGFLGAGHFTNQGGILRTVNGTPVIVGRGYVGANTPDDPPGPPTTVGQSWVYATGPILYARGATIFNSPDTIAEALDRSDNTVIYRAERDLWVGWDTQVLWAALADWTP